jgi:hypothetical protein
MTIAWAPSASQRRYAASKVPVITAYFWIIKLLTTALGEATTDFLVHRFNPYLIVPLGGPEPWYQGQRPEDPRYADPRYRSGGHSGQPDPNSDTRYLDDDRRPRPGQW